MQFLKGLRGAILTVCLPLKISIFLTFIFILSLPTFFLLWCSVAHSFYIHFVTFISRVSLFPFLRYVICEKRCSGYPSFPRKGGCGKGLPTTTFIRECDYWYLR
ncbi:hypothetical protein F4821DRAFT_46015 [Hypoxylon rubiginosum]|uniref:Uncharacterized protein n=1 Tax=Hypoxylon rubiginosum TaxID=110542 RepID=A0ACC0DBR0_9PEZI|nr:hypothetical protein F4821DRAFT_46015 [Hypoxylon rubiginosum]